ncbi:lysogeny maintenance protein PflM [Pseudomonas marincola]|uniref:lysogeny maintenance protein PflM n=1 Tax=Pseudomonas marincola TaxID=437900 RepID=UPI001241FDAD|nr:DUF5447 family protein [Pseudomonas marincola]
MSLSRYNLPPHPPTCDCSVCWSAHATANHVHCPYTLCNDCQPRGLPYRSNGRWYCLPAFTCEAHTPSTRPPKYWFTVQDVGKPTPFVPLWGATYELL